MFIAGAMLLHMTLIPPPGEDLDRIHEDAARYLRMDVSSWEWWGDIGDTLWLGEGIYWWGSIPRFFDACDREGLVFCHYAPEPILLPSNPYEDMVVGGFEVSVRWDQMLMVQDACESPYLTVRHRSNQHTSYYHFSRELGLTGFVTKSNYHGSDYISRWTYLGGNAINYHAMICG